MTHLFTNAVLTGACGGLGQALASLLIERGAAVALVGLQRPILDALAARAPNRCAVYTPDVADAGGMQTLAADWMGRYGVPDIVVANAGVAGGFDPAQPDDLAVLRRVLEINLIGVATTFQPFISAMQMQQHGALVGVASIAGWRGMPGNAAYCASKGGLMRYLESLRCEMRPSGLHVCTVSPGYLRTPLTQGNTFRMPGLMEPLDAARGILAGVGRGRTHIVLPARIGWLARALNCLPGAVYDRLLLSQSRKPRVGATGATAIPGLEPPSNPHS